MFQWMLRPLSHKCRGMMTGIIRRIEVICVIIYWRLCNSNICVSQPSIIRSLPPSVGVFNNYDYSTIHGSSQLFHILSSFRQWYSIIWMAYRSPRSEFTILIPFVALKCSLLWQVLPYSCFT